jgi:hypothetical protein
MGAQLLYLPDSLADVGTRYEGFCHLTKMSETITICNGMK